MNQNFDRRAQAVQERLTFYSFHLFILDLFSIVASNSICCCLLLRLGRGGTIDQTVLRGRHDIFELRGYQEPTSLILAQVRCWTVVALAFKITNFGIETSPETSAESPQTSKACPARLSRRRPLRKPGRRVEWINDLCSCTRCSVKPHVTIRARRNKSPSTQARPCYSFQSRTRCLRSPRYRPNIFWLISNGRERC